MRFQVPQFIEIEDKIFGPMTFKQAIYVGGSGGAIIALFYFLPTFVAVLISIPIGVFAGALAFFKVNNRPFIVYVESMFNYMINEKMYIWKKREKTVKENGDERKNTPAKEKGGLDDINKKLTVGGNLNKN